MSGGQKERRASTLTDEDIARLLTAIDASEEQRRIEQATRMESIGYDLSTPQARAEIHADHDFIRGLRKGAGRAKMAAFGAITLGLLSIIGHWVLSGFMVAVKSVRVP